MSGGAVTELSMSELRTNGSGYSLLPTPTAMDYAKERMKSTQQKDGSRHSLDLPSAVKVLFPTPTSRDWKDGSAKSCKNVPVNGLLGRAIHLFPTPCASDANHSGPNSTYVRGNPHLSKAAAMMYPTPTVGAGLCGGTGHYQQLEKLRQEGAITEDERRNMSQGNGGQLNADWVEWLMGFPIGWTSLPEFRD